MAKLVNVRLFQNNKQGKRVFTATKQIAVNDQNKDSAQDIANYCKAVIELQKKLFKLGLNERAMRKTLPVEIQLSNEDETLTIQFRNFGKFVEETTEAKLRKAIQLKLDFVELYGDFNNEAE